MTQVARIVALDGDKATLVVERSSSCGECHGDCLSCVAGKKVTFTAKNSIHADIGDSVKVESSSKHILTIAFMVYILPIVLSVVFGALVYSTGANVAFAVTVGVVLWVIMFGVLFFYSRKLQKLSKDICVITGFASNE